MYLWILCFSKLPPNKFGRFLPRKLIQARCMLCTHLSRVGLRIIKTNHSLQNLPGQKSKKFFWWYFGKINDSINTFWHHLTFTLKMNKRQQVYTLNKVDTILNKAFGPGSNITISWKRKFSTLCVAVFIVVGIYKFRRELDVPWK